MKKSANIALYLLLCILACIGFGYYAVGATGFYQEAFHASCYSQRPFGLGNDGRTVSDVAPEARASGLQVGDEVQSLNDQPFTGGFQLYKDVRLTPPGDTLAVGVRQESGATRTVLIKLQSRGAPGHSIKWILGLYLPIFVVPLFSLLVGIWVAGVRIRDPNAWLVFLLQLLYPEAVFSNLHWQFWLPLWPFFWFWSNLESAALGVVLLWFGFLFPERWRLDLRMSWLKYLVLGAEIVGLVLELGGGYVQTFHETSGQYPTDANNVANWILGSLLVLCVCLFLIALFDKLFPLQRRMPAAA